MDWERGGAWGGGCGAVSRAVLHTMAPRLVLVALLGCLAAMAAPGSRVLDEDDIDKVG